MGTVIKNVRIINPLGETEFIENGWISISGDKINEIGSGVFDENSFDEILDFSGKTVLPGMINMHHHLYSSLAIGMPRLRRTPN